MWSLETLFPCACLQLLPVLGLEPRPLTMLGTGSFTGLNSQLPFTFETKSHWAGLELTL